MTPADQLRVQDGTAVTGEPELGGGTGKSRAEAPAGFVAAAAAAADIDVRWSHEFEIIDKIERQMEEMCLVERLESV